MEQLIVSDTNIWLDYDAISCPTLPLELPYRFCMWDEAIARELSRLGPVLIRAGLEPTDITSEEFYRAESYELSYRRTSRFDRVALAIAKERGIRLVTGDGALRDAGAKEGVEVSGTIWLLDRLLSEGVLDQEVYRACAGHFLEVSDRRRLPVEELRSRLTGGVP